MMSNIIKYSEFINQYSDKLLQNIETFIQQCNTNHSHLDKDITESFAKIMFNYEYIGQDIAPVLAFRMGLGKTTLLNEYIQYKLKTNPFYSCILVVERINTIKQLCEKFPQYYGLYGFRAEECLAEKKYYNPNVCKICKHLECRIKHNSEYSSTSRVIVITHERLTMMMNDKELMDKHMWWRIEDQIYKRKDLFIDEAPYFYMTATIADKDIEEFQNALHHTYHKDCQSRRTLITYFENPIQQLKAAFYSREYIHKPILDHIQFTAMKDKLLANYYGNDYSLLINVLFALSREGFIKSDAYNRVSKIVPIVNSIANLLFNTYIFDGTACYNSTYPNETLIIDYEEHRVYPNTTIFYDPNRTLTKSHFRRNQEFICKAVDRIREQLQFHDKILLITFKYLEPIFKSYFDIEEKKHIYFDHFNNLKGKNDYRDATCVFRLGTLYKGDEYYLGQYQGDKNQIEFTNKFKQRLAFFKGTQIPCEDINNIISSDMANDTLQDLKRCKNRDDPSATVSLFISNVSTEYLDLVLHEYPGVTVEYIDWNPNERETPVQDSIIEFLNEFFVDNKSIKKSEIKTKLQLSDSAWKDISKGKNFQEKLVNNNIELLRYTLRKTEK